MTRAQREEMAAAIRDGMPPIDAIEDMIAHDIRTLEPLIDRWLEQTRLKAISDTTRIFREERQDA